MICLLNSSIINHGEYPINIDLKRGCYVVGPPFSTPFDVSPSFPSTLAMRCEYSDLGRFGVGDVSQPLKAAEKSGSVTSSAIKLPLRQACSTASPASGAVYFAPHSLISLTDHQMPLRFRRKRNVFLSTKPTPSPPNCNTHPV